MTEKSTSFKPDIVTTNELQWTDINGSVIVGAQGMANNAHVPVADIALVLQGQSLADMSCLDFCDPNHFRAGKLNAIHHNGLHCQMIWTTIAYPKSVIGILTVWMLSRFLLCLRVLTKERITSVVVHHCFLPNNISCKLVTLFISNMLMDHLCSEAISFWGKVRECTPPSKRHLCNDDRLLHLWIEDCPFSFDSVQHLPNYVHKGI